VSLNFLAATRCSNKVSISANVLPFGSGRRKNTQTKQSRQEPAQKNPNLAGQLQAVGMIIRGVLMLFKIPTTL
jgi:hypothetical protein